MLKDVAIEVPKSIETRSKCSMQAKAGDDSICKGYGVMHVMIVACYHSLRMVAV